MSKVFGKDLDKTFTGDVAKERKTKRQQPYERITWGGIYPHKDNYESIFRRIEGLNDDNIRVPTPQEMLSLMIAYHKGKLDGELDEFASHMGSFSEFSCHAAQVMDDELIVYEHAHSLKKLKDEYKPTVDDWYDKKRSFNIKGLKNGINMLYKVRDVNPELVEYLFTCKFEDLPDFMLYEAHPRLVLPVSGPIYMISRGSDAWSNHGVAFNCLKDKYREVFE